LVDCRVKARFSSILKENVRISQTNSDYKHAGDAHLLPGPSGLMIDALYAPTAGAGEVKTTDAAMLYHTSSNLTFGKSFGFYRKEEKSDKSLKIKHTCGDS